jgi:MFS family permease
MTAVAPTEATRLWRSSSWWRLLSAVAVSVIGDQLFTVALAAVLLQRGSAAWVGAMFFVAAGVRLLCATPAGWLADRRNRQQLLIAADLARAGVMAMLCVGIAAEWSLVTLIALFAISNCFGALYRPAFASWLPNVVRSDDLVTANSAETTAQQVGWTAGPAIGVLLAAGASPAWAAAVNAATFVIAAVLTAAVREHAGKAPVPADDHDDADTGTDEVSAEHAGLRSWFWAVLVLVMTQFGMQMVLFVVIAERRFGLGETGGGVFAATAGLGGIVGGFIAPTLYRRLGAKTAIICAASVSTIGFAAIAVLPLVAAIVSITIAAAADMLWETGTASLVQSSTPSDRLGRTFGRIESVGIGSTLIGILIASGLGSM